MIERDIQPNDWRLFCEQFTRQHQGWLSAIDISAAGQEQDSPIVGTAHDAADAPFQVLLAIPNPHGTSLLIEIGRDRTTKVLVDRPTRLKLLQTEERAQAGICIDAANGQKTQLTFRVAAPPERTDGLNA